ncbi:uncharacterized protein LOC124446980 isoform X1 [Xenia sp. Carnegie-2017]|uniref:uncharacterized protein LOC124446980 isoform X1 n=2 Tax=Xenia sp. Carnegie-2017 TaxID=2897299 RepID=UPI001F034A15|nr:uncharacterized protein LOC124446980 isoform X1 [Xenia sp. Carnegie-2017]XP_046853834.1 uncharacterized protein LOC124446980 isoform X1 [Xenia sp. Carnegie-2017]XP_046853835.1 uncharacterized protein LOC124446980 isoform X1 [Xenia sp. Carnegie-2017]XP_046853836.1 uncharacterized protein LOC124446980 isoform X1 [Xenia sp. Carnegie-2017]
MMMSNLCQREELCGVASHDKDTLELNSKDFQVIRFFLRFLSLWRPLSAGYLERYVYPITINLLLAFNFIRNAIQGSEKSILLNIQFLYMGHEIVVWIGHILANRYFASRDLENNVLSPLQPLAGIRKVLCRKLRIFNAFVVASMLFFSTMLWTLYIVTGVTWHHGANKFSAELSFLHGWTDNVVYGLVIVAIVYDVGVGLALFWTLALLYVSFAARLKILEKIFLKWTQPSVDAVSCFVQVYAKPVKQSWKRLSWWFITQNVVALGIPLYGYSLAQAISGSDEQRSRYLPQFICYLIFIVTIWLAPIFVGELIKRREKKFEERINNVCPWLIDANCSLRLDSVEFAGFSNVEHVSQSNRLLLDSASVETCDDTPKVEYTFASRGKELKNFLRFLKKRKPGLVSRGYSLQLNLSLISLFAGGVSFLIRLNSMSTEVNVRNHLNCCNATL